MRIVGGHDYYDSAMAHGQDTSLTFVRPRDRTLPSGTGTPLALAGVAPQFPIKKIRGDEVKQRTWWRDPEFNLPGVDFRKTGVSVILCGKRYNGLCMEDVQTGGREWLWSLEALQEWLAKYGCEIMKKRENTRRRFRRWRSLMAPEKAIETYFDVEPNRPPSDAYFIAARVTLAVWSALFQPCANRNEWLIDAPVLKQIQFFRRMGPFEVYQEIQMWLGNVLIEDRLIAPPRVEITDDDVKLAKHGMDHWSFRKVGKNSKI